MNDFNPITLFAISYETMGVWTWLALFVALLLLAGIVTGILKLRNAKRSPKRPIMAALFMGVGATLAFSFVVPRWTLAQSGSLNGAVDYLAVILLAMIPGAAVASMVFSIASRRCAVRGAST